MHDKIQQPTASTPVSHRNHQLVDINSNVKTPPTTVPPMTVFLQQDRRPYVEASSNPESSLLHPCKKNYTCPTDRTPKRLGLTCEDEEIIDVVNDSHDSLRVSNTSKDTDISMTNQSSSVSSSPVSGDSRGTSPASTSSCSVSTPGSSKGSGSKKKVRTNYSPEQVQKLERQFQDNPYPDTDTMEQLANELGIQESKIKVWFQNKRARWRRRVSDTTHAHLHVFPPYMTPMSPMSPVVPPVMSPVSPYHPYGFVAPSPVMSASSPQQQMIPGHFFPYPSMTSSPPLSNRMQDHGGQQTPQPSQHSQLPKQQQTQQQELHQKQQCQKHQTQQQPPADQKKHQQHQQHPQQELQPQQEQQPQQMLQSPMSHSLMSPYQPRTPFSPYVYPYAYGHYSYYC